MVVEVEGLGVGEVEEGVRVDFVGEDDELGVEGSGNSRGWLRVATMLAVGTWGLCGGL